MKKIIKKLGTRIIHFIYAKYLKKTSGIKLDSHRASLKASYGRNVSVGRHSVIADDVTIGDYSYVNVNSSIENADIGKYCSISEGVRINPGEHHLDRITTYPIDHILGIDELNFNKRVIIGNDVLICINAIILQGVCIHDGAVIGAGAVVTKDVPPYAIVGGVPAKVIRYRFSMEIINKLLNMRWWEWSEDEIIKKKDILLAEKSEVNN